LAIRIFFGTNTYLVEAMTPSKPSSLPIWPIGWTVRHVAETGSTNDDLVAAARAGAPDRTVIVADYQTAGKGRLDRTWEARRGSNLLVSLLFRYESHDPSRFSRIVALAARVACERLGNVRVSVKWPNDLIIGDRKLGGLLAVGAPQERFVVVGIGVNVGWAPDGAAALSSLATPLELLAEMLREIDARLGLNDSVLREEHKSVLATLGSKVRVELRKGEFLGGTATDLDELSRLMVVDDAGRRHVIDVGDVVHLRAQ
jgi:BirA family biotin operon repressor/biotin-[acetyl-CoA-carboxylase] ligase